MDLKSTRIAIKVQSPAHTCRCKRLISFKLRNKLSWGGGVGWVGVGGWLDQVGIMLTQLSTGLKAEAEFGKNWEEKL